MRRATMSINPSVQSAVASTKALGVFVPQIERRRIGASARLFTPIEVLATILRRGAAASSGASIGSSPWLMMALRPGARRRTSS
jgi:hypothetical protein